MFFVSKKHTRKQKVKETKEEMKKAKETKEAMKKAKETKEEKKKENTVVVNSICRKSNGIR